MRPTYRNLLAIEAAIGGGSLSLIIDGEERANWIGSSIVSRAEDLLPNIDGLLRNERLAADDLDLVTVSAGPGSFTGIRIGIATALGLSAGIGVPVASQSALVAMVLAEGSSGSSVAALPVGRNAVCIQHFEACVPTDLPRTIEASQFLGHVEKGREIDFILHEDLAYQVPSLLNVNVRRFGKNLAFAIGSYFLGRTPKLAEPLFISKSF